MSRHKSQSNTDDVIYCEKNNAEMFILITSIHNMEDMEALSSVSRPCDHRLIPSIRKFDQITNINAFHQQINSIKQHLLSTLDRKRAPSKECLGARHDKKPVYVSRTHQKTCIQSTTWQSAKWKNTFEKHAIFWCISANFWSVNSVRALVSNGCGKNIKNYAKSYNSELCIVHLH